MRKRWFKVVVIVALILLPVGIYRLNWAFPEEFESVFDTVHRRLYLTRKALTHFETSEI